MSDRDWKPGDVALRRDLEGGIDALHFRTDQGWVDSEGDRRAISDAHMSRRARRLAVIDPESREDIERLAGIFCARPSPGWVEEMQAALREFADPQPEEPTGLGAVVEDESGQRWVRATNFTTVRHWRGCDQHWQGRRRYDEIAVVRVLSEGVSDD